MHNYDESLILSTIINCAKFFLINLLGFWFTPEISGIAPPPCSQHSLVNLHGTKALLMGGFSRNENECGLYELSLAIGNDSFVSLLISSSYLQIFQCVM